MRKETIKLPNKVVDSAGNDTDELVITEPSALDIWDLDQPYKNNVIQRVPISAEGKRGKAELVTVEVKMDAAVVMKALERCINIDVHTLKQQPAYILLKCRNVVADFLEQPTEENS